MSWTENKLISLNSKFANKLNGSLLSNVVFPFSGILKNETNMKHVYISPRQADNNKYYYDMGFRPIYHLIHHHKRAVALYSHHI